MNTKWMIFFFTAVFKTFFFYSGKYLESYTEDIYRNACMS